MTNPRDDLMAVADLRAANVMRQKEWDALDQLTLAYRGNELAGEVGEACNIIKKLERERLGINGSRDTVEHLAEELADVIICTDLIAMQAGIDLDAAVIAKFNASSEKVGLATRLAASRPAPVDREAVARAIFSNRMGHNEGRINDADVDTYLEQYAASPLGYEAWKVEAFAAYRDADTILSLLRPAEPVEAEHPALKWSLSDDAKRRISEIDENIRHAVIASPGMKAGGIQPSPDGFRLVPVEPTPEMLKAYSAGLKNYISAFDAAERQARWGSPKKGRGFELPEWEKAIARYRAMLAASPAPAVGDNAGWRPIASGEE